MTDSFGTALLVIALAITSSPVFADTDCFTERGMCDALIAETRQCKAHLIEAVFGNCDALEERARAVCDNAEELCRKENGISPDESRPPGDSPPEPEDEAAPSDDSPT